MRKFWWRCVRLSFACDRDCTNGWRNYRGHWKISTLAYFISEQIDLFGMLVLYVCVKILKWPLYVGHVQCVRVRWGERVYVCVCVMCAHVDSKQLRPPASICEWANWPEKPGTLNLRRDRKACPPHTLQRRRTAPHMCQGHPQMQAIIGVCIWTTRNMISWTLRIWHMHSWMSAQR